MRKILAALTGIISLTVSHTTAAAELRWPQTIYSHYSNQEPLRDVLESLAASQSIPLIVSDKVQDVISVSFTQLPPVEIFQRLVSAYKLTWYFDGSALYVYRIDEIQSSVITLQTITPLQFQQSLQNLGVFDPRFRWNTEEQRGLVYFSGPPRFLALVNEMAKRLDVGKPRNADTVYSWVDRNGVTHYSSAPPPANAAGRVTTIELQTQSITAAAEQAKLPAGSTQ